MLNDKQIEELRKLILMEADQTEEASQEQSKEQEAQDDNQIEPTPEELYAALQNGEIDIDTIDEMHNNGQISDENYQALVDLINSEQAAEEETNPEEVIQSVVDAYLNGEITDEDIDKMLQNGEIDEDAYNQILQLIQEQMGNDVPQEEPQPIAGKYNQVKLFDYFIKLQKCIQLYMDTYKDIEMDQVSSFQMKGLYRAYKNITTLKNNLDFYMENNFTGNDYKENLTQYITLQRDFADELRKFRHILHLNPNKIIEQRKEEQEKNKKD